MAEQGDWPPAIGHMVKVIYGLSRNKMTGEVVGIQGSGDDAVYLVEMTMPSGERRAHIQRAIRCRLSDLDKGQAITVDEFVP